MLLECKENIYEALYIIKKSTKLQSIYIKKDYAKVITNLLLSLKKLKGKK